MHLSNHVLLQLLQALIQRELVPDGTVEQLSQQRSPPISGFRLGVADGGYEDEIKATVEATAASEAKEMGSRDPRLLKVVRMVDFPGLHCLVYGLLAGGCW